MHGIYCIEGNTNEDTHCGENLITTGQVISECCVKLSEIKQASYVFMHDNA